MAIKKTIIVIGDGTYSLFASKKARQYNEHARIIMVKETPFLNWSNIHLKHHLHSDEEKVKKYLEEQDALFSMHYNVELKPAIQVLSLDMDSHCITLDNSSYERLPFDALIFTGAVKSRMIEIPGLIDSRVVNFETYADLFAIKKAITEGACNVLVIGSGYFGITAALSLKALGLNVTMIESKKRINLRFSLQFAKAIEEKLLTEKIALILDDPIVEAKNHGNGELKLLLSSGKIISTDLVVMCKGIEPETNLLVNTGAALDGEGLIRVDDHMQTTLPNVYACASAISVPCAVDGKSRWLLNPSILQRTAEIAGINAANEKTRNVIKPFCKTLLIEINDKVFACTGVNEQEAQVLLGDDNTFVATVLDHETCIKLVLDRTTKHLIGGEIFGKLGVERHIDIIALAVKEGLTADYLIDIDLAYSKDFASSYELLKEAAMRARSGLLENTRFMSAELLALWLKNNKDFRLIDVGDTPKVSDKMTIKTIHLPLKMLRERMHELADHDNCPIVLYSSSGHCSYLAHQMLIQRGLTNVYHVDGGLLTLNLIASKE